jgi:hypothetical protein
MEMMRYQYDNQVHGKKRWLHYVEQSYRYVLQQIVLYYFIHNIQMLGQSIKLISLFLDLFCNDDLLPRTWWSDMAIITAMKYYYDDI